MNFYLFWSVDDLKLLMIIFGLLAIWLVRTRVKYESNNYSSKNVVETVISLGRENKRANNQELDKWIN